MPLSPERPGARRGRCTTGPRGRHGPDSHVRLSPGDLDEAVTALLTLGRSTRNASAGAFDRIAGFRDGTLDGLPARTR
ncbi:hypothetical protein J2S43_001863 [Catenuloplanes nepalensis]|uniref:Uncharacterized protein n=1 Tax=Catenuloplanes nepalensis TaxID=587533 RepID=A0ABT9MPU8_9ACTN|nr:hypothetical protein [Catenuloplanes nepalensis]MDP9793351.1 hypothetical protein [Catenuloplanes nepalensis]